LKYFVKISASLCTYFYGIYYKNSRTRVYFECHQRVREVHLVLQFSETGKSVLLF
jgi:hypothetical protein